MRDAFRRFTCTNDYSLLTDVLQNSNEVKKMRRSKRKSMSARSKRGLR